MKTLLILLMLSAGTCYGQDSIRVRVTKVRTSDITTYYWLQNVETKERYYTVCSCKTKREKGEIVAIAKKDLFFVEKQKAISKYEL